MEGHPNLNKMIADYESTYREEWLNANLPDDWSVTKINDVMTQHFDNLDKVIIFILDEISQYKCEHWNVLKDEVTHYCVIRFEKMKKKK